MIVAIMQPYFFPYLGYFQLMAAVDRFILYDDVNYIKQGWINRNRILINNQAHYLTLDLQGASSFKKINEVGLSFNASKLLKTIKQAYGKAPFYQETFPLIDKILFFEQNNLAAFVINSIREISAHLAIKVKIHVSSELNVGSDKSGQERVIEICRFFQATKYINAIGGKELYSKEIFRENGITLKFINSNFVRYQQFDHEFVPFLSIIDVMMFNAKEQVTDLLQQYTLI